MPSVPYEYVYLPNPHGIGEDLEDYGKHGLYPVELGAKFNGSKSSYQIIHKLGHGGTSTTWVAHDSIHNRLVALKILMASNSTKFKECDSMSAISQIHVLHPFTVQIKESFSIKGPNCTKEEKHIVLIFELLGPSLERLCFGRTRLQPSLARKIMHQTAEAVNRLHQAGIAHRDLTAGNVLLRLDSSVSRLASKDFIREFGAPEKAEIEREDGRSPQPEAPLHTIKAIDFVTRPQRIIPNIVLIDFGESGPADQIQKPIGHFGIPAPWAAPEVIIDNIFSTAADVWSLGCLIFQARAGQELFGLDTATNVFFEMILILGQPPFKRWRHLKFDEFGYNPVSTLGQEAFADHLKPTEYTPLRDYVFNIRDRPSGAPSHTLYWGTGECCVANDEHTYPRISSGEAELLYDLLSKIFKWDPEKRINAAEVMQHSWFEYR